MKVGNFSHVFSLLLISALLVVLAGVPSMASAQAAAPAAENPGRPVSELLNPDGSLNLSTGYSGSLDVDGYSVSLDPLRGPVFSPALLASPGQWTNAGAGQNGSLNNQVFSLAVMGTDLYVGGDFQDATNNGVVLPEADRIAKWDGSAWSALGSNGAGNGSLDGAVRAMLVVGTDLYVGGDFNNVNNNGTPLPTADNIAKWDGSTWSALGSNGAGNGSLNGSVNAMALIGTDLYIGGWFSNVNNNGTSLPTADYVAKWDGSAWSALGSNGAGNGSISSGVRGLAVMGTDLYVGGFFTNVNNNGTPLPAADYVVKWNGSAWSSLGSNGGPGNGSINSLVYALAVIGTDLYVGGSFSNVNNNGTSLPTADKIAKWNGSAWSALGSNGAGDGSINNGSVYVLAVMGTDLYAGGDFTDLNNNGTSLPTADRIAKWNGSAWSALGSNGVGDGSLNNNTFTLAVNGTDLYVGGNFTNVNNNGTGLPTADNIAKWDGSAWSVLGSSGVDGSLNSRVRALAVIGTDLYVGGDFTDVTDNSVVLPTADYIAKWDGTSWSALGSNGAGNGSLNGSVNALAVIGTDLYAAGYFAEVNNNGTVLNAADFIAKWDGSAWSALGSNGAGNSSINSFVFALAVIGTDLYVGGNFWDVNNNGTPMPTADKIAKWNGSAWSALGSNGAGDASLNSSVYAIAVNGTDLYTGGAFTDVNNNGTSLPTADYIARWNGSAWSALGSNGAGNGSLNDEVFSLAFMGTNLYAGGAFTDVNNNGTSLPAADYIARWNGSAWSALGSNGAGNGSITDGVNALAVSGTDLYVGGYFQNVNNNGTSLSAADRIAKWNGSAWSALGSNGAGNGSLNFTVFSLAIIGTDLYVGGDFWDVNNNGTLLPAADKLAAYGIGTVPTPTPTVTATSTITPTQTETPTVTVTSTPTITLTATQTETETETPTVTPTSTPTMTATQTESPTGTMTKTSTVTETAISTVTTTSTITATKTSTVTATATVTPTITKTPTRTVTPTPTDVIFTQVLKSIAAEDGWILESSETSGVGGTLDDDASVFRLGDEVANQQYRSILSFNTGILPDTAIIQSAVLKIKQNGAAVGTDPFTILGSVWVDMRKGIFGTGAIELADFNSPATATAVSAFSSVPVSTYYTLTLGATGRNTINTLGRTQFRLRFGVDDNNDLSADYMKFLTGEFTGGEPQLTITYIIP